MHVIALLVSLWTSHGAAADALPAGTRVRYPTYVVEGTVVEQDLQNPPCGRVATAGAVKLQIERVVRGEVTDRVIRIVVRCAEMMQVGQRYRVTMRGVRPASGPLTRVSFGVGYFPTYYETSRRRLRGPPPTNDPFLDSLPRVSPPPPTP